MLIHRPLHARTNTHAHSHMHRHTPARTHAQIFNSNKGYIYYIKALIYTSANIRVKVLCQELADSSQDVTFISGVLNIGCTMFWDQKVYSNLFSLLQQHFPGKANFRKSRFETKNTKSFS